MLIYVAGPYRGDIPKNIENARKVAIELWKLGHVVICPHANSVYMDEDQPELTHETFIQGDLKIIARCDAVVVLEASGNSKGTLTELNYADCLHIPVYDYPDLPPLHPTEINCPQQCQAYAETLGQMYRTHLSKNADYSPANILATGEVGVAVRLSDKILRLMNLLGFRVQVQSSKFEQPREPKHEAIDDTYLDAASYSVIGWLVHRGLWGK